LPVGDAWHLRTETSPELQSSHDVYA